jgi:hypothetical protein
MALMTLVAVGLTIGAFTFSASAQDYDQKEEDHKIVILYNQFEEGRMVKVDGLKLLCVPTHKEIYEGDGKQTDGQQSEYQEGEKPKDEYKYDHFACYKVKDVKDYQGDDKQGDDDKKY